MYSILTTTQTSKADYLRQFVVVAVTSDDVRVWTRVTNGGRGVSNAWTLSSWHDFQNNSYGHETIVGELLASPLSSVDVEAINNNEAPIILFQKLTKQFGLRHKTIGTRSFDDVVSDVVSLIAQSPSALSKYRSDGRINKSVTTIQSPNKGVTPINKTITPPVVIQRVATTTNDVVVSDDVLGQSLAYVPSIELVRDYVPRTFNGLTEEQLYDYAITNRINVLIEGEAGTGKTTSAMRYSALRNLPFYSVSSNVGAEPSQLFGKYVPDSDGNFVWQDGGVTQLVRHGGVLLLNEINFLPPKVATVLMGLLDDRRQITLLDHKGEVINANPNLLVIADYNEGYRGTSQLNQAFADRFGLKLSFEYDSKIESKFIQSKSLLELANKMRADSLSGIYETPISTRLLKNFVQHATYLNYEFAVENFLNNFNDEERPSVRLLMEAYGHSIATELGCVVDDVVTEHEEDVATTSA
jgi:hypothetical protein